MEKPNYRENLETIRELFPTRISISPHEAAAVLGVNVKTVYESMKRRNNPIPSIMVNKKRTAIPIAALAKWMSSITHHLAP